MNYGPKTITNGLVLYLDAANKSSYPGSGTSWTDLSGNSNDGQIYNCEIVELNVSEYKEIFVPFRRKSLFDSIPHEENGFVKNNWKESPIRWNQLRFLNEVKYDDSLIENDGLSTIEYTEHERLRKDRVTFVNVGI